MRFFLFFIKRERFRNYLSLQGGGLYMFMLYIIQFYLRKELQINKYTSKSEQLYRILANARTVELS